QWTNWVFGLEADGAYLWARNSSASRFSTPNDPLIFNEGYFESTSFKTHYLFTVGPRIGYAFCKWLPYITGGLAVGDLDFSQRIVGGDIPVVQGGSTSDTQAGWMLGGGLEYVLTGHWRARVQYQYVDLGSVSFHHATSDPD